MEKRDLFTELILHVIPTGIGLDDFAGRLRSGPVVRQEGRAEDACPNPVTISCRRVGVQDPMLGFTA